MKPSGLKAVIGPQQQSAANGARAQTSILYSFKLASIKHSDTHDRQIVSRVARGKKGMRSASVSATLFPDGSLIGLLIDESAEETL